MSDSIPDKYILPYQHMMRYGSTGRVRVADPGRARRSLKIGLCCQMPKNGHSSTRSERQKSPALPSFGQRKCCAMYERPVRRAALQHPKSRPMAGQGRLRSVLTPALETVTRTTCGITKRLKTFPNICNAIANNGVRDIASCILFVSKCFHFAATLMLSQSCKRRRMHSPPP